MLGNTVVAATLRGFHLIKNQRFFDCWSWLQLESRSLLCQRLVRGRKITVSHGLVAVGDRDAGLVQGLVGVGAHVIQPSGADPAFDPGSAQAYKEISLN